ncbi:hypothetical protein [Tepidimicrobium xylanilyticum]|uniref:hypothetical protein n=1 Tax=Tepidimicrobium xylanilyticum TaxID=1123352 RepID=UPI001356327B|nr:hypothetical protein [Tepidimicrobium xylanilyticum]GMG96682.1 hypothetical protein EN5CB1_15080 [Tepidimicrobium xylanilyticum]
MDKIDNEILQLCTDFLLLLEKLKEMGRISEIEFESHVKLKKRFIHQEKSKLST